MSRVATDWAWSQQIKTASIKLLLLALADRADEYHRCYPSIARLESDTGLNRKTIISNLDKLCAAGVVIDTGKRTGKTGCVKVYQLQLGEVQTALDKAVPKMEQYQKRNSTKNGCATVPKTDAQQSQKRYLEPPIEPSIEPKDLTAQKFAQCAAQSAAKNIEHGFEVFYSAGLVKKDRHRAMSKFTSLCKALKADPVELGTLLASDIQRRIESGQFGIDKLHPSTYLNQRRWEDSHDENQQPRHHDQHQAGRKRSAWERQAERNQQLYGSCGLGVGQGGGDLRRAVAEGERRDTEPDVVSGALEFDADSGEARGVDDAGANHHLAAEFAEVS